MTKTLFSTLSVACWSLLLISACVPTMSPSGSSASLNQQFSQLQQLQQQQAEQIKSLQLQIELLQQPALTATTLQQPLALSTSEKPPAPTIPIAASQEITALTNSAASYLAAFSSLAAGRSAAAEAGFTSFIDQYPDHQYAANARYWLASAQFAQGKQQAAASNLRQVIIAIDGQKRAPAALTLLAKIYRQQQLDTEADEVLEQLRSRYPESTEAQQFYRSDEPQP